MEYIKGHNLDSMVADVGPLPLKLALHCTIQAAQGLEAAHAQGIVHRDIKPGNLILDDSGQVKVLDLGLARVIEAANPFGATGIAPLTQTGAYMGTVDFIAPEQADDSKRADHRADIYSLGCTLYFLMTARPPFEDESALKRLIAHQNRPAPSLKAQRPEVSKALESTYLAMMAKRPDDRPRSMSEVVALLEACRASPDEAREARATLKTFNERR
jgi:serine/threonine protein kinase